MTLGIGASTLAAAAEGRVVGSASLAFGPQVVDARADLALRSEVHAYLRAERDVAAAFLPLYAAVLSAFGDDVEVLVREDESGRSTHLAILARVADYSLSRYLEFCRDHESTDSRVTFVLLPRE